MGLERFQVEKAQFWSCSKSAENRATIHRNFVRVKTYMGLELFEIGSPFRPTPKKEGFAK